MNQRGFALASDSAVSSGSYSSNSVQKIFTLPGRQPVGFMVMGSGIHAPSGLSWDRIFHNYHLHYVNKYGKTTELDDMETYREDFTTFVNSLITKEFNDRSLMRDLYYFFANENSYIWRGVFEGTPEYSSEKENTQLVFSENIDSTLQFFSKNVSEDVEKSYRLNQVKKNHSEALDQVAKDILEFGKGAAPMTDDSVAQMTDFLTYHIVYHDDDDFWKTSDSQIVLAGFGSTDQYPVYFTLKFSSVAVGMDTQLMTSRNVVEPRATVNPFTEDNLTFFSKVYIEPFAIKNFTMRITTGMDNDAFRTKKISKVAQEEVEKWLKTKGKDEISKIAGVGATTSQKIVDHLITDANFPWEVGNAHWGWVSSSLNSAKKEFRDSVNRLVPIDLAKMAKHLIETEAIMSSFIHSQKQVDLPVDVCYVTKENGFIWSELKNMPNMAINPKLSSISRDGELFY
ncbi:MAG: hypothetical protein VW270_17140 [Candidatus Poseidoniales archaeon]